MGIFDIIDLLSGAGDLLRGKAPRTRNVSPEELRVRAQEAEDKAEMQAMGASMLAFYRQDKKCASCKAPITEDAAVLRLVNSEGGMAPENVILVCKECDKKLSASTPQEGM